jgi:hypothetical protein
MERSPGIEPVNDIGHIISPHGAPALITFHIAIIYIIIVSDRIIFVNF